MPTIPVYPSGRAYLEAIQDTERCFKDPVLAGGSAITDNFGLPKPISGNFASVFTIRAADGKRWAVKCFTRNVSDQELRYQRISETLLEVEKPWRVAFEYIHEGILCQGQWYPILKMEWIEASGLIPYIESHLWEPPVLADLASKFAMIASDLEHLGVAHGDLQHGNLLMTPSRELKLIDYDGMYVPGLRQLGASEIGHANYQSLARTISDWNSNLDHFSSWLIYASLVALTIDPMLWSLLHQEGDEALLFHKDDFLAPSNSRALVLLSQCIDDRLRALGDVLSPFLTSDLESIPALNVTKMPSPNSEQSFFNLSSSEGSKMILPGSEALQGIADWLKSIDETSSGLSNATNDQSWVVSHLPPIDEAPFEPSNRQLRVLALFWIVVCLAGIVLWAAAIVPGIVIGIVDGILLAAIMGRAISSFGQTPEVVARREVASQYKRRRTDASQADRAVMQAVKNRRDVEERERRRLSEIGNRVSDARASETKELQATESSLAKKLSNAGAQTRSLQTAETNEVSNLLLALQQQYIASVLQSASIRTARIQGIGQKLHLELARYGVTTAYDFTSFVTVGTQAQIVLRTGQRSHVSGIGESKARALNDWRRNIETRARSTQPSSLPQSQAQAIRLKYAQQLHVLIQSEQSFRAEAVIQQNQIRERWKVSHATLAMELSQTRQLFLPERARTDLQLSTAKREAREASWRQINGKRELSAYRGVSFRRYCVFIFKN